MKLITKEIRERTPLIYGTEDIEDKIVTAKFFNPCGIGTWYLIELADDNNYAFGFVDMYERELGYFMIHELEEMKLPFGLSIERDIYFKPTSLKEIRGEVLN